MTDFNKLCEELVIHLGGVLPPKSLGMGYRQALLDELRRRIPYLEVLVGGTEGAPELSIMGKSITCFGDFLTLDLLVVTCQAYKYFHPESTGE